MSWTGLLGFLFLTAVVIFSLSRMGVRWSDLSRKNNENAFKKRPKLTWALVTVAVVTVGYLFARKVFPQIFPDWVSSLELGLAAVIFIPFAVFLFMARKDNRIFQEKTLTKEMLRPIFEDESQKAVRLESDEKS